MVQLGVPIATDKPPEYVWKFFPRLRVKKISKVEKGVDIESFSSQHSEAELGTDQNRKRRRDEDSENLLEKTTSQFSLEASPSCSPKIKRQAGASAGWTPSADMQCKLAEQEKRAQEVLRLKEKQLEELQVRKGFKINHSTNKKCLRKRCNFYATYGC